MACGEFSLIARYFDRVKSARLDVETGIGDDCALLNIPEKKTLAISTDPLVAGNHFLPDIDPADLAYKALAVNLSDLAAMGAEPAWLTLALTLPEADEAWLEAFSDSLFVQLLKPSSFTPVLAVIGIILYLTAKGKKKDTGLILLGFATLMFGMESLSGSVSGLRNDPNFTKFFLMFSPEAACLFIPHNIQCRRQAICKGSVL